MCRPTKLPCSCRRPSLDQLLLQGDPVDAVAHPGRRRAVGEDVAEVAAAARAMHLVALHAIAVVPLHRFFVITNKRRPWSACAGLTPALGVKDHVGERLRVEEAVYRGS